MEAAGAHRAPPAPCPPPSPPPAGQEEIEATCFALVERLGHAPCTAPQHSALLLHPSYGGAHCAPPAPCPPPSPPPAGQEEIEATCFALAERLEQMASGGTTVPELMVLPIYSTLPSDLQVGGVLVLVLLRAGAAAC